jgi:hypothetical protein
VVPGRRSIRRGYYWEIPHPVVSAGQESTTTEVKGFTYTSACLVLAGPQAYCRVEQEQTMTQGCKVCLAQHDDEIHAATNRVHGWFRAEVMKHLHAAADDPMLSEAKKPWAPQLNAA